MIILHCSIGVIQGVEGNGRAPPDRLGRAKTPGLAAGGAVVAEAEGVVAEAKGGGLGKGAAPPDPPLLPSSGKPPRGVGSADVAFAPLSSTAPVSGGASTGAEGPDSAKPP